ncbi:MAG: lamin tail domain-containing protein, partial [Chitinophagales bacterium]|nr:lamin tail domain-containing protein [Chitinophagales bacterium]
MIKLLLYTALVSVCISSTAQVSIIIPGTPVVETFTGFTGSGFAPTPSSGQLDADNWQITGFSDGNLAFGGTRTTGDYARGVTGGNVTVGGIYGYSGGLGNQALYIQPAASDFVPGTITTRYLNITGTTITSVDFSYVIYNYNNEARSTSLKLSYSFDNISFTNVPSADFNSFGAADFLLYTFNRSVTIPGLSFLNGGTMYLKWTSDDVIGFTGNRDEIGLDNITLNAHTDPIPIPVINFNSELPFYDEGVGTISVDVQIATPHDCNAFIHINHDVTSAINGVDFILPEETEVSFSAGGGIIQTISIPILNDINPEYQDAIYLEIDSVSPGCSIGEPHFKLMFIDDNDDPVIADCSNLIISQYGEGSGVANNKVLEIYNPTPSAVDLSNYWVQIYLNGNLGPSYYFNCNGMLAAGDAYVITPEDANPALLAQADTVGGGAAFDGNDAVVLYQGPDMIDKIGIIGVDPGPGGWMVAAGSTTNNSLSR